VGILIGQVPDQAVHRMAKFLSSWRRGARGRVVPDSATAHSATKSVGHLIADERDVPTAQRAKQPSRPIDRLGIV
jgi:hypothetical protein